jgi:hypothetical protein
MSIAGAFVLSDHGSRPPWPVAPSLSTFSVLALGVRVPGRVLFPGRAQWPVATLGYVRSAARDQLACRRDSEFYKPDRRPPWRDYDHSPSSIFVAAPDTLIPSPFERYSVVVSARNTLNEWGYQLRLGHDWIRRGYHRVYKDHEDKPISPEWPVIAFGGDGTSIVRLGDAAEDADLVTGIPLVVAGQPSSRPFFIACCSDVAHVFDVNPRGQRGPSADAWSRLSDLWQKLKDQELDDANLATQMEEEARRLAVTPSRDLLHSVLAQRFDGILVAFAITGALTDIASELAQRWDVQHAVLLDNGGSVGWQALIPGTDAPKLLVAGPNYRPKGTAFMQFDIGDFLQPQSHPLLGR